MTPAFAIAAAAVTATGLGGRAANALVAFFLLTDDIPGRKPDDHQNYSDNNVVDHRRILLAGKGVFLFQAFISVTN